MRREEKAKRIVETLDKLFPEVPIPLDHRDPFTLLVAVMLSAQSTDKKVNEITPRLFERAPDAKTLARMKPSEVQEMIREIGLAPTKAKNLVAMANALLERHGGEVPRRYDELVALPGVGPKTAQVVLAQAFGEPAFPVDTHIHRLAARWGLSDGSSVAKTECDLKRTFDRSLWNKLHLQMIYFGREYCPARGHDLDACPICSWAASKPRKALERKLGGAPRKGARRAGRSKSKSKSKSKSQRRR